MLRYSSGLKNGLKLANRFAPLSLSLQSMPRRSMGVSVSSEQEEAEERD
jgi:hypothetical protein